MTENEISRRFALKKTSVLLLEDNDADVVLITRWLGDEYSITRATHLKEAVPLLVDDAESFDVVVADLGLPDANGYAVLSRLSNTMTAIPVVVLTGHDDEAFATKAIEFGVQDYLVKDFGDAKKIQRVLRYAIARRKAQAHLIYIALHDSLTGVGSAALLGERLGQSLRRALRRNEQLGVLCVNIDRFKAINEGYGYAVGDEVLQQAATRMKSAIRESDSIMRIGGDQFAIVLEDLERNDAAKIVVAKLMRAFTVPFSVWGDQFEISTSIGVAFFPEHAQSVKALTNNACHAMRAAKRRGGKSSQLYQAPALDGGRSDTGTTDTDCAW